MLNITQIFTINCAQSSMQDVKKSTTLPAPNIDTSYRVICTLILSGAVMMGVTGCGQKGALYVADTDSQMVTSGADEPASEVLDSTSHPQDAGFATIDDNDYQKTRYLEQKQVLPDVSDDPNDY